MNPALSPLIGELDAMRPVVAGEADASRYKEWHHFNLTAEQGDCSVILNLGLSGDLGDPGSGQGTVILIVYRRGLGWLGSADFYPADQAVVRPGLVDMAIGSHAVRYDRGRYHVNVALKDNSLALSVELEPRAFPLPVARRVPFGDWIIIPRLVANGELRVGDEVIPLDQVPAYHDHNRGYWHWQEDFGWDWGYVLEPARGIDAYSVVFQQATDRLHNPVGEGALVVWRGQRIFKGFLTHATSISYGELRRDLTVPRLPPVLNLILGAPRAALPGEITITAREESDWLDIRFKLEAGLQIMLPHENDDKYAVIHELWGTYTVRGEVKGQRLSFTTPGFAEWAAS